MATDGIRMKVNHVHWCEFHSHAHFILLKYCLFFMERHTADEICMPVI